MIGSKLVEIEVPQKAMIVSHTDLNGVITYANDTFCLISGYSSSELVGKPHNILRHPDMPSSLFKNLWETIAEGKMWSGYVKNMTKDGGYYWVYAHVSRLFDKDGKPVGYKSLRQPVSKEKRNELEESYTRLKEIEEHKIKINTWIDADLIQKLTDGDSSLGMLNRRLREILG